MRIIPKFLLLHSLLATVSHASPAPASRRTPPREVVRQFLAVVRSGLAPDRAADYLAPRVVAHQLVSEAPEDVVRTPAEYAAHVHEFLGTWGNFQLEVTELLADGDRVYARWVQRGRHLLPVDGHEPSGEPVSELASAVYRVQDGRIVEYWIQIDRAGTEAQLRRNATVAPPSPESTLPRAGGDPSPGPR